VHVVNATDILSTRESKCRLICKSRIKYLIYMSEHNDIRCACQKNNLYLMRVLYIQHTVTDRVFATQRLPKYTLNH
jgi:hypothetical protein